MIENNQNTENNSQGLEVNLDALSAPEGNYDPVLFPADNAGDSENPPGDDGIPENLPNLDEELSNQNQELDQNNSQDQIVDNTSTQSDAQDHYWMKPFEQLKEANPEWEIPEGINEENYIDVLQKVLTPQQSEQQDFHPELVAMQEALNTGATFEQVMKSMQQRDNVSAMSDRELLAANYQHHYKDWDDKKVNQVLDKLDNAGMLEIEAGKLRNQINEQQQTQLRQQAEQDQVKYEEQTKAINAERDKQIKESLNLISQAEDVYGLPITPSEKQEFGNYFSKLVTPDETGSAPMMQMLQSNETLVKVAMMLWKGDEKIRAALTDAKESGKNAILNKLDSKPSGPRKGGAQNDPSQIDFDALAAPERFGGFQLNFI